MTFLKIFPVRCSLIAYTKGRFIGLEFGEGPIGCSNIYINYFVMIAGATRSVVQSLSEVSLYPSVYAVKAVYCCLSTPLLSFMNWITRKHRTPLPDQAALNGFY
jgi:hypothetical protein